MTTRRRCRSYVILCKRTGENATTPADPQRVFNPATDAALLEERGTFCVSFDNDMLVDAPLYETHTVELPAWLPPEEWVRSCVRWKYLWAVVPKDAPEAWQRGLMRLSRTVERMVCWELLRTQSFRSDFRRSLRDQLVAWLDGASEYGSPFSARQWERLIDRRREVAADRLGNALYYTRKVY